LVRQSIKHVESVALLAFPLVNTGIVLLCCVLPWYPLSSVDHALHMSVVVLGKQGLCPRKGQPAVVERSYWERPAHIG
jgi:hypothetical protein